VTYKGFQVDFLFEYKDQPYAQNYLYINIPGAFDGSFGGNEPVNVLNRWQRPGDVKAIQRFSQDGSVLTYYNNARQSNQIFSNDSYIRLKNLSFSWQIPAAWKKTMHLQTARLYIHGQNLLTITKFNGLDPETSGSSGLPPLKVFTAGIQVTL
jgi:hypothetical protein